MTLSPSSAPASIDSVDAYLRQMSAVIEALPREPIQRAVELLVAAGRARRRIYLVGNGGSAATASHMANDLCKQASVDGRPMLRAIALTDNMPLVTAWSNDEEYADCFARQLDNHLEAGDLLIAISCSGNSPNVLRAIERARAIGAGTIGMTGGDGGALADRVDCCISVPSENIGQQEDGHLIVNHVLSAGIRARLLGG